MLLKKTEKSKTNVLTIRKQYLNTTQLNIGHRFHLTYWNTTFVRRFDFKNA